MTPTQRSDLKCAAHMASISDSAEPRLVRGTLHRVRAWLFGECMPRIELPPEIEERLKCPPVFKWKRRDHFEQSVISGLHARYFSRVKGTKHKYCLIKRADHERRNPFTVLEDA